ncbi:MAG: GNAT family N-acetyltransferase [Verrucomicrobiae bacterium]|nr:GNAT family N-acetyltransferase [Verrucomicrobiae bacterium]
MKVDFANINDLEQVALLFDQYRQFYKQESNLTESRKFIEQRLVAQDSVIFLAKDENQIALGFTQLYPLFNSITCKRSLILYDLFVATNYRRQGVAQQLMKSAKDYALKTGVDRMELSTAKTNASAQKLYESLGWKIDPEFHYYVLELP